MKLSSVLILSILILVTLLNNPNTYAFESPISPIVIEMVDEEILLVVTDKAEEKEPDKKLPVFIQQRRWPLPSSINPGTNCTYFTDGTKYCR